MEEIMTVEEVAMLLKSSDQYVRDLVKKGAIPSFNLPETQRGLRFRESEIQTWIAKTAEEQRGTKIE